MKSVGELLVNIYSFLKKITLRGRCSSSLNIVILGCDARNG